MRKLMYVLPLLILPFSCEKDPEKSNDEELITTLELRFIEAQGTTVKTLLFTDLDGDGGNAPVITGDTLSANMAYSLSLRVLNESETPAENITLEVEEEGDEHQFFFESSTGLNLSVAYADTDADGNPVGIINTASTGAASSGTLKVTLRHEPNKTAANVSAGDIANAGGSSDIEVSFPVNIQ